LRPLTVLTGIILGSSAATTFGLAATLVVFVVLSGEHPQFRSELPLLAVYLAIFMGLTALAGASFIGLARQRPWWRWAQAALWATLCILATVYWQTRG
jgi:FtsH-binding integral membrane protein